MPAKKRNPFIQMLIRLYNFLHAPTFEEKLYFAVTRLQNLVQMDDISHGRRIQSERHDGIPNPGCPPNTPEDEYVSFVLYRRDYNTLREVSQMDQGALQKSLHLAMAREVGKPPIKSSKSLKRRVLKYVNECSTISEGKNFDYGRRLSKRLSWRSSRSSRKDKISFKSEDCTNSFGGSLAQSKFVARDRDSMSSYETAFTHISGKSSNFKPTGK